MGETEKNLQAAITKLSKLSKKGFGIARESIVQSSHVVKSKIDITSLQREKKKFVSELGEAAYAAIKEGTLKSDLFDGLVANIDEVEKKIEEKEEEIVASKEAMSAEGTSPPEDESGDKEGVATSASADEDTVKDKKKETDEAPEKAKEEKKD